MSTQGVIMISAVLLLCLFEATTSMSMKGRLEDDTTGFCMSSNKACSIVETGEGNLLYEYNQTNMVGCTEYCSMVPRCSNWTWWGDSDRCQIFSACQDTQDNCTDCQTGPRSCGIWEQHISAVSGGFGGHQEVFMVEETKFCSSIVNLTMPSARWGHSSAFIESKLILCGGSVGNSTSAEASRTCDIYCMDTQRWLEGAAMEVERHGAAGGAVLGKMYMVGGSTGQGETASMEVYDPSKRQWSRGPDMPAAVTGACAVVHRDALIVSGGTNSTGESLEVYMFNVTSNRWWQIKPMKQARANHGCSVNIRPTAHMEPDYEMILTGGVFKGQAMASAEALSINTMTWTHFDPLPFNLSQHVQFDQGRLVVLGGLLTGVASPLVLQYNRGWELADYFMTQPLAGQSVTAYPRDLVRC